MSLTCERYHGLLWHRKELFFLLPECVFTFWKQGQAKEVKESLKENWLRGSNLSHGTLVSALLWSYRWTSESQNKMHSCWSAELQSKSSSVRTTDTKESAVTQWLIHSLCCTENAIPSCADILFGPATKKKKLVFSADKRDVVVFKCVLCSCHILLTADFSFSLSLSLPLTIFIVCLISSTIWKSKTFLLKSHKWHQRKTKYF